MKPFRAQDFAIRRGKKQTQDEQLAIFDNLRAKHGKGKDGRTSNISAQSDSEL